ncbi:MAG: nitroreductase family protein [Deltaproteobacteria bacterium]|nr:nitroreductase family protein [Deltaproteobacteria bacterium]
MRFLLPHKPVEREKIQLMLEAATLCSFWGNVQALKAVVIERATAPKDVIEALPPGSAIAGFQLRLAPVLIVWYCDWSLLAVQGERLHELVEAGAVGVDKEQSHRFLNETLVPFFQAGMEGIKAGGMTEMDCGQGIAQATLMAFEQGLGTCLIGVPAQKKLRRALALPADCKILAVQTVGYPAESPEAGGQRPRLPFETKFFLNKVGQPFPRDLEVVEGLKRDKMIQAQAPLPWRQEELAYLSRALEISPIFGNEVAEMTEHIMKDIMESSES